MAGINKAILIGNLGRDPEVRYTANGTAVANFSIATTERWKDRESGEQKEQTEWHRIVAFGRLGEICGQYLSRGKQVYIEGKIQTREWEDKEGNKRYTTEIVASAMQFLGARDAGPTGPRGDASQGGYPGGSSQPPFTDDQDDDIPF